LAQLLHNPLLIGADVNNFDGALLPGSRAGRSVFEFSYGAMHGQGNGCMNKKIVIALVLLLLLAGGGAGAFFMLQQSDSAEADATGAAAEKLGGDAEPEGDPIYLPLSPAFVVNFEHNGAIRYLQLGMQAMSYDQAAVDKVEANMPAVRNNLILMFSAQDYEVLNTVEGKENLRKEVLDSINKVVRLSGESAVNDVFFTSFVVQ
jgi:flagellar FliL protein